MNIHAHLREHSTGKRDASTPASRLVTVHAATYEAGRDQILRDLADGWLVASWRVDRTKPN